MTQRISIDPITRLEGHGKIDIFLDRTGEVANAYLQVPELRGFERFCVGRPAEEMPNLTARICGVCPEAHHMAATKALDALFDCEPPRTAKQLRDYASGARESDGKTRIMRDIAATLSEEDIAALSSYVQGLR